MYIKLYLVSAILFFFLSCNSSTIVIDEKNTAKDESKTSSSGNYLSMKINGVEWKADNGIWGAFHPQGYNKAIMIAGNKGPKIKINKLLISTYTIPPALQFLILKMVIQIKMWFS